MNHAKAVILNAVLKQERPFKAARIYQMTDLSRSLIQYHLKQFVTEGALEKAGMFYAIRDRDTLLDIMVNSEGGPSLRLATQTPLLAPVAELNRTANELVGMRILNYPLALQMRKVVLEEIDRTIASLKDVRKYINEKSMVEHKAAKMVPNANDVFEKYKDVIVPEMGETEWKSLVPRKQEPEVSNDDVPEGLTEAQRQEYLNTPEQFRKGLLATWESRKK